MTTRTAQKRPGKNIWDGDDGTTYVLGYMPTECAECCDEIGEDEAGYIRDGPAANGGDGGMDEVCFWCGNEVTGFAN